MPLVLLPPASEAHVKEKVISPAMPAKLELDTRIVGDTRSQRRFGAGSVDGDVDDDDDDLSTLPFAQPLPRSAFLTPNFKAPEYLSTLRNRHQTLTDLRAELRTRSHALAKELLDLVNNEYQAFLGLGSDLRGGEEKVEAVRVAVLGFVNGVESLQGHVAARKADVDQLLRQKKQIAAQAQLGRQLVEVHARLGELEHALTVTTTVAVGTESALGGDSPTLEEFEDVDDAEDLENGQSVLGVRRLEHLVMNYLIVQQMIEQIGHDHPFLLQQNDRIKHVRGTLMSDLGITLRQAKLAGKAEADQLLRIAALYVKLDEPKEAITVLKETAQVRSI